MLSKWDYAKLFFWYLAHPAKAYSRVRYALDMRKVLRAKLPALRPAAPGAPSVCVSLTSYGSRIRWAHVAIRSMMLQTVPPNRIVLWLGEESDDVALSPELVELERLGVEIRRGVENLKSHKKYYFAMKELEGTDTLLITVDDDILFPPDVVQTLLEAHAQLPECVVARRTHRIKVVGDAVARYLDWDIEFTEKTPVPRKSLVATTGAGVLYPPSTYAKLVADPDDIRRLALHADDLWLRAVETTVGVDVAFAPNSCPMPHLVLNAQEEALAYNNVEGGNNDVVMDELMSHFSLQASDFVDD
jgi:hypothetical protein